MTLAEKINAVEFDVPFRIVGDDVVEDLTIHAPEVYSEECVSGMWVETDLPDGWDYLTHGMTGQYGYAGPWMHSSEFIGRRIAERLAEQQENYEVFVVIYATPLPLDEDDDFGPDSWAIVGKVR